MVSRGYTSPSFLYEAARYIEDLGKPAHLYHFGDFDPSGQDAAAKIAATLRELAPDAEIYFDQVAVRPWQVEEWRLPTRPTKATDSRTKRWTGGESVELDAIDANQLRDLCELHVKGHIDRRQLAVLEEAERSERELLTKWAATVASEARS